MAARVRKDCVTRPIGAFHLDLLPLIKRPIDVYMVPRMSRPHAISMDERLYIRSWWRLLIDP
jgi:hypothetical protein